MITVPVMASSRFAVCSSPLLPQSAMSPAPTSVTEPGGGLNGGVSVTVGVGVGVALGVAVVAVVGVGDAPLGTTWTTSSTRFVAASAELKA